MVLLRRLTKTILKFTPSTIKNMIRSFISILLYFIHVQPISSLLKAGFGNRLYQSVSSNLFESQQLFQLKSHPSFVGIGLIEGDASNGYANLSLDQFQVRSPSLSIEDVRFASTQIGFPPHNIVKVGAYKQQPDGSDDKSHPYVLILYPVNFIRAKGQFVVESGLRPFPTVTWMSSTELSTRVAKLEVMGYITKLFAKLNSDPAYMAQMKTAHERYTEFRWNLLSDTDKELFIEKGWDKILAGRGIGGIENPYSVKCLHTHYAHHLARPQDGNLIGQWVDELLKELVPE